MACSQLLPFVCFLISVVNCQLHYPILDQFGRFRTYLGPSLFQDQPLSDIAHGHHDDSLSASAIISGAYIRGELAFYQASSTSPVVISGEVHGLHPGDHGMHVHEHGDLSQGCDSAGEHFNPYNKNHGGQKDTERHLGDLGNIKANAHGIAKVFIIDNLISLKGPHSIVGRTMVIHEHPDDLGKGGDSESKETGNSGGRIACGVIVSQHQHHGLR